jgi:hypothetical protein
MKSISGKKFAKQKLKATSFRNSTPQDDIKLLN